MAKSRNLGDIQLHEDSWKPVFPKPSKLTVNGLDTETNHGDAFLMTVANEDVDASGFKTVTKDYHHINSFDSFIKETWRERYKRAINFFYNIDFDFTALVKHLGRDRLSEIAATQRTFCYSKAAEKEFQVRWIPNKAFSVTEVRDSGERGEAVWFYDVAQFFNKVSLKKAASIVGQKKLEFDTAKINYPLFVKQATERRHLIDAALADTEMAADLLETMTYRERLLTYALQDAYICQQLGARIHKSVNRVVPINQYFSTATIAQTYFLSHIDARLQMPPAIAMRAALLSYGGGRFEMVRRGYFDKVWEIDINSAYPYEFAQLPALGSGDGRWKRVRPDPNTNVQPEWDPNAVFAFYDVEVETHGHLLSPIMHRLKDGIIYPHGKQRAYIEKSEMRLLDKMGFKVKILDGVEYAHDEETAVRPFHFINDVYNDRQRHKIDGDEDLAYVLKIVLNSAYGKTIQLVPEMVVLASLPPDFDESRLVKEVERPDGSILFVVRTGWKAGKMFNPVYAAAITARVRARLLETVIDNKLEDSIIGFATDCLYLKTPPPQHVVGQGLGAWKLEAGPCEGLFIGSGVYALKSPGYKINHFRGFKTKHDLFASLAQGITSFTTERPVKLREGIKGGVRTADGKTRPVSWEDIGSFLPQTKSLDVNFDRKRQWDRPVKDAHDLLTHEIGSKALVLGK